MIWTEETLRQKMRKEGLPSMMDIYYAVLNIHCPGISESIRKTEARWKSLECQVQAIERYEIFFGKETAAQEPKTALQRGRPPPV
jgi:hypothetical protein